MSTVANCSADATSAVMANFPRHGKLVNPVGAFGSFTTLIGIAMLVAALVMERLPVDGNSRLFALIFAILIIFYALLLFGYFHDGDATPSRPPGYRLRMAILAQNYIGWLIGPGLIVYVWRLF